MTDDTKQTPTRAESEARLREAVTDCVTELRRNNLEAGPIYSAVLSAAEALLAAPRDDGEAKLRELREWAKKQIAEDVDIDSHSGGINEMAHAVVEEINNIIAPPAEFARVLPAKTSEPFVIEPAPPLGSPRAETDELRGALILEKNAHKAQRARADRLRGAHNTACKERDDAIERAEKAEAALAGAQKDIAAVREEAEAAPDETLVEAIKGLRYRAENAEADVAAAKAGNGRIAEDGDLYRGNSVIYWYDKARAYREAAGKVADANAARENAEAALAYQNNTIRTLARLLSEAQR